MRPQMQAKDSRCSSTFVRAKTEGRAGEYTLRPMESIGLKDPEHRLVEITPLFTMIRCGKNGSIVSAPITVMAGCAVIANIRTLFKVPCGRRPTLSIGCEPMHWMCPILN